jgi:hypothetical protein
MNGIILGSLGVYSLLVGFNGNGQKFIEMGTEDAKGFLPWAISAGVLAFAYEYESTKPLVAPFLVLMILGFVLRNFETLKNQLAALNNAAQS